MTKTIDFACRCHEKGPVESVQENPNNYWAYVNSKTKTSSGISDIKAENGTMHSIDVDKTNILNNFFTSVLLEGGNSRIKDYGSISRHFKTLIIYFQIMFKYRQFYLDYHCMKSRV